MLLHEPRTFRRLLEKIARATAGYLKAQIAAGASAVQLFDSWVGELDAATYRDVEMPAVQLLMSELGAGDTPVILFSKGTGHLMEYLPQTGVDVLSVVWRADLPALQKSLGRKVALQGNVDPCTLLGPVDAIGAAVARAGEQTGGLGHILNLGHGILPETPVESALAFVRAGQAAAVAGAR